MPAERNGNVRDYVFCSILWCKHVLCWFYLAALFSGLTAWLTEWVDEVPSRRMGEFAGWFEQLRNEIPVFEL